MHNEKGSQGQHKNQVVDIEEGYRLRVTTLSVCRDER
jgi:hypothetical protein